MKRLAPAALLLAPFATHAGLGDAANEQTETDLQIQIWYTVIAPDRCTCMPRPFTITETFDVVSLYAPPDSDPSPAKGDYTWDPSNNGHRAADFIMSRTAPDYGLSGDYVRLTDAFPGSGWDELTVVDVDHRPQYGHTIYDGFTLKAPFDFIDGDGFVQSFDFSPQEVGGTSHLIRDVVEDGMDHLRSMTSTVIDRIRAVPRTCHLRN